MKKVYIVNTSFVSCNELSALFAELIPEVKVFHIVDESLLHDVSANGGINPNIIRRMCAYFQTAALGGADLIFNQCSSVGEAADIAAKLIDVPVLKVDEAMAEQAVRLGRRIAVVATVKSTVAPSCRLVERKAAEAGADVQVMPYLVEGALDVLMKERNREKHNKMVLETVKQAEQVCDVIVLAQGSMTVLLPELTEIQKPVLTSPRLGVLKARQLLLGGN